MRPNSSTPTLAFCVVLLLSSAVAFAGTPDGIVTPASSVDGTSATLNGLVNPNNESTTVTFEYSEDAAFGGETPVFTVAADQSPLTGNGYMIVSKTITGLNPGTRYHFRIVSANATATDTSPSTDFLTNLPATVDTGVASPVDTTTATLNGMVNANGNSTTVTFEYGTTTAYGTTVTADQSPVTGTSDTAVSKAISGLTPGTTYHFRVVGSNVLGDSNGEDSTFFTSAQTAPSATTEDATYSLVANTATLNGLVNANNADTTVTFEYGTTTAYGTTVTADQSPVLGSEETSVSKLITGLSPNTTYHYRVVGTNSLGTTNGADRTFFNTTAPYARTDPAANVQPTSALGQGLVNPKRFDDSNDTTVTFEYGLTPAYGSSMPAIQSPVDGSVEVMVSAPFQGLTPNTTYHYRVVAENVNGTGTGADQTFTTSSLPSVNSTGATPVGTTSATLNGTVNANGDSTTVTFEYGTTTAYGTTVTADQSPVTGTTTTSVSKAITGLASSTTYHYRVVGENSSGTSNGEDLTFTTGLNPPSVTTDAPTSIGTNSATMNGTVNANGLSTSVSFEWGFTEDYGQTDAATPSPVAGGSPTSVSFTPVSLLPNMTYHYRVVGTSAGGTIRGADMTFTTSSAPKAITDAATSLSTTGATLNGTVNAFDESTTVTFEYGTTTAYGTTVTADQSPVTGSVDTPVSKSVTGLTPGTTYHYRVVGANASGTTQGADQTFFTSAPAAPTATTDAATSVVFNGATLNGTVTANNASTTVTFEYGTTTAYGTTVTADQSPLSGTNATAVSKQIGGLTGNTTYHYRVVGQNSLGTTNGADMTFTTSAFTPSATTGDATNVLFTSATMNGIANGNIAGATVTFEYGLTPAYGTTVNANPNLIPGDQMDYPVSADLTGLTPNTTYHYRAVADNAFSSPQNGADRTFTTTVGPTATTNAATAVGPTSATLNGTANANGNSTTVTFEYGLTTSYGKVGVADQSPLSGSTNTAVSFTATDVVPNATYHYRVVSQNSEGTANGADMTFTTPGIPPTATTAVATAIDTNGATFNGVVNANNSSTTVTFEYGTTTAYGTTVTADQSPVSGNLNNLVSKAVTGLTTDTTYHYRVVGQSASGTTNGADQTVFITAATPPTAFSKAFSSTAIASGNVQLAFAIQNLSPIDTLDGLSFTDNLSAVISGLEATALVSNDCGGTVGPLPASLVSFSGGTLAPTSSCSIVLDLSVPGGATTGTFPNTTSDLFAGGLMVADPAMDDLTIVDPPPTFAKSFDPSSIGIGQISALTFTIDNSASGVAATGLDFTDNLPAGVTVAPVPNASTTCTGGTVTAAAGSGTISYTGGTVGAGAVCTVVVDVTASAGGTHVNTSGDLTSSLGNSGPASDTLTANAQPVFSKSFAPNPIATEATSTLTFTIDNTASTVNATALAFTDGLPAEITIATTPNATTDCIGGALSAPPLGGTIDYTGGAVSSGATCSVTVDVTSAVPGMHVNTSGDLTSSLGNSGPATDTLTVNPAPGFSKSFAPNPIATEATSTLTFTIDNTASTVNATALAFTDVLPADVTIASAPNATTDCIGGALSAPALGGTIDYTGGAVSSGATCSVTVDVTSAVPGMHVNTSGDLTSSLGNSGPAIDTLTVDPAPGFSKWFAPNPMASGTVSTLTFTIDNTASTANATALAFTDVLPADVTIASTPNATTDCVGGALSAPALGGTIDYTGGTVSSGAACSVTVDVTSTVPGMHVNTSGDLTSSLGNSGPAVDTLEVLSDGDGDGVPNNEEDAGPNGGDGNNDSIPDSLQNNVSTLLSTAGDYMTLIVGPDCMLAMVSAVDPASLPADPFAAIVPQGMLEFRATLGGTCVSPVPFTVHYHGEMSLAGYEYRKYGPHPVDPVPGWYSLPADFGTTDIGLGTIATVTFSIADGGLGDDGVGAPDGEIVDQGGPTLLNVTIPTLSKTGFVALVLLLGLLATAVLRRR